MSKQKNDRFIVNKEVLSKGKQGGVDWYSTKEVEVYFTDDDKNYILKVDDVIKDKNYITKVLFSYNGKPYKRYLQSVQILNGNLESVFGYYNIKGNKLIPYRLSDDGTYWIGTTNKGEEFWFNGKYSEEIMKWNWFVSNGYVVCNVPRGKTFTCVRLNRMVLGVTDRNIVVNHRGSNVMDNRVEMLSISDYKDNMKELSPSVYNNTGITGLTFNEKNNKYNITCTINGYSYTNVYLDKDEALIDLLIIQRHYKYRHNEKLYYMLDNIIQEYINDLIEKVEDKIKSYKVNPIICKNKFELSEDGSFYYMYDKDNNRCKISIEDLDLVKQGNWHHTLNNGKDYFSGAIIYNGQRKSVFLHRFLMDLIDPKYRYWYIDHLDSDGLNNLRESLVITDAKGNSINQKKKDIKMKNGSYLASVKPSEKHYFKTFYSYDEAMEWRDNLIKKLMSERLEFKSREELDEYIEKQNINK